MKKRLKTIKLELDEHIIVDNLFLDQYVITMEKDHHHEGGGIRITCFYLDNDFYYKS